jgi:hypothetical protein
VGHHINWAHLGNYWDDSTDKRSEWQGEHDHRIFAKDDRHFSGLLFRWCRCSRADSVFLALDGASVTFCIVPHAREHE